MHLEKSLMNSYLHELLFQTCPEFSFKAFSQFRFQVLLQSLDLFEAKLDRFVGSRVDKYMQSLTIC